MLCLEDNCHNEDGARTEISRACQTWKFPQLSVKLLHKLTQWGPLTTSEQYFLDNPYFLPTTLPPKIIPVLHVIAPPFAKRLI